MPKVKRKRNKTVGRRFKVLKSFTRHGTLLVRSKLGVIVDDDAPKIRTGKALFTHIGGYRKGRSFTINLEGMFTVSELQGLMSKGYLKEKLAKKKGGK